MPPGVLAWGLDTLNETLNCGIKELLAFSGTPEIRHYTVTNCLSNIRVLGSPAHKHVVIESYGYQNGPV